TKPTVSMLSPFATPAASCPLRQLERLVGEIDLDPERALHHGPFPQLEAAQSVHDEGIGFGDLARRLRTRRPYDGEAVAADLTVGLGQRTGREQHALLLQTDHVFEMAWQMFR